MRKIFPLATSIVMGGLLLGFSIGCSSRPSDDTISKDIQNKVAADPDTKDSTVSVASKDGNVTLKGTAKQPSRTKETGTDCPARAGNCQCRQSGSSSAATPANCSAWRH